MYYPYFRGKQYELITIRETAGLLAKSKFVPIIEPVKEALSGLDRTLQKVRDADGEAIIIVNPYHGDHREDGTEISALLKGEYIETDSISVGILLREDLSVAQALDLCSQHPDHNLTFVHAGFTHAKALAEALADTAIHARNVFFEAHCGKLYRKHFKDSERILLRDGFQRRRNRDYERVELFSDLHVTFEEEGMDGFGDFLIVGDDYSETGGPAYTVAIHLTFIDPEQDDAMYIYHFLSKRMDTPTDPAGKFEEALTKMFRKFDSGLSNLLETDALKEFRSLKDREHFPGLGYVKKLSMKHHIETLADFFA